MTKRFTRRQFIYTTGMGALVALSPLPAWSDTSKKTNLKFGIVTDSHYADRSPGGIRYYRESIQKMEECISVFNQSDLDFIVHLGDFKDESATPTQLETLSFLDTIEQVFQTFEGPKYHAIGNHDVDSIRVNDFIAHTSNTGIETSKSYYSFDLKGHHFIVLDTNFEKDGNHHFFAGGSDWQDPNIASEQTEWLQKDLEANELPTIVFSITHSLSIYEKASSFTLMNTSRYKSCLINPA